MADQGGKVLETGRNEGENAPSLRSAARSDVVALEPVSDDPSLDPDKGPVRTCLVKRVRAKPDEMLRFVATPDGGVIPDLSHKLPGRGVWITAHRSVVAVAVKKRLFGRGLKAEVTAGDELLDLTERLLLERALQALSMARKAGQVVTGFSKVEAALNSEQVRALVHASDAQPDGVRKILQIANRVARGYDPDAMEIVSTLPVIKSLSRDQLDLALGGENVIHAALLAGGASRNFLARFSDWVRFTSENP